MGLVDQITSGIGDLIGSPSQGTPTSPTKTSIMNILLGMIEDGKISLPSLLSKFSGKGLQSQAQSWVGGSQNTAITGADVQSAIDPQHLDEIATKTGLPKEEAAQELASVIPSMIDKLTPNGEIPNDGVLKEAAGLLRSKLSL